MEYGSVLGAATGGLGGGAVIAALPNTGGSLRVVAIAALVSIFAGTAIAVSALVRSIALRRFGA